MAMDLEASSLGHKLRTKVCCCFGAGSGERAPVAGRGGLADRIRWRRRVTGEFRYDALSYALNFDEGDDDAANAAGEGFRYRNFSSRLPPSPASAPRTTAIAIA